jgi:hypothetical protein
MIIVAGCALLLAAASRGIWQGFLVIILGGFAGTIGIGRIDALRAWQFFTSYFGAQPRLMMVVLPLRRGPLFFNDTVDSLVLACWLATLYATGPLGMPATLALDRNFPHDHNWLYLLVLTVVSVGQWSLVWLLGRYVLRADASKVTARLVYLVIWTGVIFGAAGVTHILIASGKHM